MPKLDILTPPRKEEYMVVTLSQKVWEGFSIYLINDRKNLARNGGPRQQVRSVFNNLIRHFEGLEFNREQFNLFLDLKRTRDNTKPETLNNYIKVVKNLDRYFAQTYTGYSLQFLDYRIFTVTKKRKEILTFEEMLSIANTTVHLDMVSNDRYRLLVMVLALTGGRITEVCYLETERVYFDYITFTQTKNQKERDVAMPPEVCEQLRALAKGKYVFSVNGDIPLADRRAYTTICDKAKEAGIQKRVNCHLFRHSFISNLANSGASLVDIRDIAGHENIATTNTYLHSDINRQKETLASFHPMYRADSSLEEIRSQAISSLEHIIDHNRFNYQLVLTEKNLP